MSLTISNSNMLWHEWGFIVKNVLWNIAQMRTASLFEISTNFQTVDRSEFLSEWSVDWKWMQTYIKHLAKSVLVRYTKLFWELKLLMTAIKDPSKTNNVLQLSWTAKYWCLAFMSRYILVVSSIFCRKFGFFSVVLMQQEFCHKNGIKLYQWRFWDIRRGA